MSQLFSFSLEYVFTSAVLFGGYIVLRRFIAPEVRRMCLYAILFLSLLIPQIHFSDVAWLPDKKFTSLSAETITKPLENVVIRDKTLTIAWSEDSPPDVLTVSAPVHKPEAVKKTSITDILVYIYAIITASLFGRLLLSLFALIRLYRRSDRGQIDGMTVRLVPSAPFAGASFFRHIFLNREYANSREVKTILFHERVHRDRWHSADMLISELHTVFFWFNPVAWLLRNELRINAEIEADSVASNSIAREKYISDLVAASIISPSVFITPFSSFSLKRRLKELHTPVRTNWKKIRVFIVLFVLMALVPVACTDPMDQEARYLANKSMDNISKITTTYVSHQEDTQEKDEKIISIAFFSPDQKLEKVHNLTSYPYTSTTPKTRVFVTNPNSDGLFAVMDGLSMKYAERNFLYGNDWPAVVAAAAEKGEHYDLGRSRLNEYKYCFEYDGQLPVKIKTVEDFDLETDTSRFRFQMAYEHQFEYQDRKVTRFTEAFFAPMGGKSSDPSKNQGLQIREDVRFEYDDGERLIRMRVGKESWTFQYNGDQLAGSEFYINDKRYNRREYYYNKHGLKLRTEIFNLYDEPEYTIRYSYEFYQQADI